MAGLRCEYITDPISAAGSTYTGVLPPCDDTIRPDSPNMITHYDESTSIDYIFICPWWLRVNEAAMAVAPYQPWDTRLTVYDVRYYIQLNQVSQHAFKMWRNGALNVPPDLQGLSDVALSWAAADVVLKCSKYKFNQIPFLEVLEFILTWSRSLRKPPLAA